MTAMYDAIIIGTGQAGPFLAGRLAESGRQVAIVERKLFGGTCVNTGCTPTKTMVASAYAAHLARRGAEFGVNVGGKVSVDMPRVKARRDAIVESGLQIYIEVGDADMFHLDEGNEFLHRVLWDHGIAHEYRLVHGADHLGRTLPGRLRDGFRFLTAHVLNPVPPDNSYVAGATLVKGLKAMRGVDDSRPRPPLPSTSP
jgi:glycine/D-amino acid oxidase-like deaminating enzyme